MQHDKCMQLWHATRACKCFTSFLLTVGYSIVYCCCYCSLILLQALRFFFLHLYIFHSNNQKKGGNKNKNENELTLIKLTIKTATESLHNKSSSDVRVLDCQAAKLFVRRDRTAARQHDTNSIQCTSRSCQLQRRPLWLGGIHMWQAHN